MKINFSELLASERVRPLWGRSYTPESALDELQRIIAPLAPPAAGGPGDGSLAASVPGAKSAAGSGAAAGAEGSQAGSAQGQGMAGSDGATGDSVDPVPSQRGPGMGTQASSSGRSAREDNDLFHPPPDLADVPIRAPHEIFADLEQAVRGDLGNRACMVRNFIEALRVRIHALDPTADEALYHPMRHAAGGTIWELLTRMEDTLSGLRRVASGR
ncbi:MAG TPA: hypothetical protein PKI03_23685 [Pseudomonadota bacterium]|nr:hypothetical protein [Pseudomonadota bacterium]